MQNEIDRRLNQMGIELPVPAAPIANYVPCVKTEGPLVFISGQLPRVNGQLIHLGKLGKEVSVEQGREAARACAINLVAELKVALGGDLAQVKRCVRLTGFVAGDSAFTDHPAVVNGASDFMTEVFGDAGKHARAAFGVSALPANAAVEVDAVFELRA